jgi:hypothetical protein
VARDQAHRLAAAKTADPDNADANAHGGVVLLECANKFSELSLRAPQTVRPNIIHLDHAA